MFGYIKTDLPYLFIKDDILYKSLYCGVCKSIGKTCGQRARLVLNYDLTFLNLFVHNIKGVDIKIEKQHCVTHWFKKKSMALTDEISDRVACLNVLMAYYKLSDDINDNNKGKTFRTLLKKSFKKAKRQEPELERIVKDNYKILTDYEKSNGDSVDIAADSFGNMLKQILQVLLKEDSTSSVETLGYFIGKWIYLIDALDDYDADIKKKNFNVLFNNFKKGSFEELIKENREDVFYIFSDILTTIETVNKELDYKFNHDLIDNILTRGLRKTTAMIMEGKKCKKTTNS